MFPQLPSRKLWSSRGMRSFGASFRAGTQRPIGKPAILRSVWFPGCGPLLEAEAEQAPRSWRTVPALRLSASESPTLCSGESHSRRQRVPLSMAKSPTLSRREWDTQPLRLLPSAAESGILSRRDSYPQPLRVPLLPQCSRSDRSGWSISRPTHAPERGTSGWRRSTSRWGRGSGQRRRGAGTGPPSRGQLNRPARASGPTRHHPKPSQSA